MLTSLIREDFISESEGDIGPFFIQTWRWNNNNSQWWALYYYFICISFYGSKWGNWIKRTLDLDQMKQFALPCRKQSICLKRCSQAGRSGCTAVTWNSHHGPVNSSRFFPVGLCFKYVSSDVQDLNYDIRKMVSNNYAELCKAVIQNCAKRIDIMQVTSVRTLGWFRAPCMMRMTPPPNRHNVKIKIRTGTRSHTTLGHCSKARAFGPPPWTGTPN